jgi:hypothetical protein
MSVPEVKISKVQIVTSQFAVKCYSEITDNSLLVTCYSEGVNRWI